MQDPSRINLSLCSPGVAPWGVPQADFQDRNPEWLSMSEPQTVISAWPIVRSISDEVWGSILKMEGLHLGLVVAWFVHQCFEWLLCPRYWVGPWDTVVG